MQPSMVNGRQPRADISSHESAPIRRPSLMRSALPDSGMYFCIAKPTTAIGRAQTANALTLDSSP